MAMWVDCNDDEYYPHRINIKDVEGAPRMFMTAPIFTVAAFTFAFIISVLV